MQFQTLASTADPLVARFGIGYAEIGTLIGLFMLPGLFLSLPAGTAGRYASDQRLVSLGLVLMPLGGLIAASAAGVRQSALARLVTGAGFVFCTLYFTKMVVDWFSGRELATALGILVMSWPFGIAAGQVAMPGCRPPLTGVPPLSSRPCAVQRLRPRWPGLTGRRPPRLPPQVRRSTACQATSYR